MKIVVLCGGISTERNVSLTSGAQVYGVLKEKHDAILLDSYLGYEGDDIRDVFAQRKNLVTDEGRAGVEVDFKTVRAKRKDPDVFFGPNVMELCKEADIVFLALHGGDGEDGKIQAAFDLYNIKYTGTDYLSSAIAMNKARTKELFTYHKIPTPESCMYRVGNPIPDVKLPAVVKVCNGGSSIGVYIVNTEDEYKAAMQEAVKYDGEILIEEYIKGRELTMGVMDGKALPGVEIAPKSGTYDYTNKYEAGATVEICPAPITEEQNEKMKKIAEDAYRVLGIKTYVRFDFIMTEDSRFYCLEGNTLPGMTKTSLIPQEAKAVGVEFPELCEWIIKLSLAKYE
ncbi:MAG: D-alanine--D-alanine ligase [Lachnospiraceae bacterium]|nr:D-alanine--D-alanine ligase [Candidatus Merdinaster equi]